MLLYKCKSKIKKHTHTHANSRTAALASRRQETGVGVRMNHLVYSTLLRENREEHPSNSCQTKLSAASRLVCVIEQRFSVANSKPLPASSNARRGNAAAGDDDDDPCVSAA